jgi:hypothetical protein
MCCANVRAPNAETASPVESHGFEELNEPRM